MLLAMSMCIDKKICLASSDYLSVIGIMDCKLQKCMVGLDNNAVAISSEDPVSFCIIYIYTTHILRRYTSLQTTRNGNYMADIDNDLRHVIQPCKARHTAV